MFLGMSPGRVFKPGRVASALAVASVIVCCGVALFSIDYLPTHDGPQHIYTIHAANHLADPATGYDRFLAPNTPITSHGFFAFFGPLDLTLPWKLAFKVSLFAMTLLFIAGSVVLARTLHPARIWLGIALAAATFRWTLYMGLFSFYIATSFGLFILAYALANASPDLRRRVILGCLLFVQALFHIFPAVITAGIIGLVLLAEAKPGERIRSFAASSLMCAPVVLLGASLLFVASDQVSYHGRNTQDFVAAAPPLFSLAGCLTGGPDWRAWPLTLLALAAPAISFALAGRMLETRDRVLLCVGCALLLCGALMPLHIPVWDFFSVRFLPCAVICMIVAIPLEKLRGRTAIQGVAVGLTLFAVASCGWAIAYNRDLDARSRAALAGIGAPIERTGPRLAIVMDPFLGRPLADEDADMPYVVPLLNLAQIYATEQGGVPADTFAISAPTHQVLFRRDGETFPAYPPREYAIALRRAEPEAEPLLRRKITTLLASYGARFEDVILWGKARDAESLIARGFVPDWRDDGLLIAHFEGCPLSIAIEPVAGGNAADFEPHIELGWYPLLDTAMRYRGGPVATSATRESQPTASTSQHIDLVGAPCGPVWLRVRNAREDAANPASPPITCRGADEEGRLILADSRQTPQIRCTLVAVNSPFTTPIPGLAAQAPDHAPATR